MRYLKADHDVLDGMLKQLKTQLAKPDPQWAFEALDLFWASLAVHIRAENICLFPALLNASRERFGEENEMPPYDEVRTVIEQLRMEHSFLMDQLGKAMKELRIVLTQTDETQERPSLDQINRRIAKVTSCLTEHNQTEEEKVYLWPAKVLDAEDLSRLELAVRTQIENLPSRFAFAN